MVFFENTGTASAPAFAEPSTSPFGLLSVGSHAAPAFADIDGDADLDAFVGNFDGRIAFFENLEIELEACEDGLDNDSDGQIDAGSDPGCASGADPNELSSLQCDDGVDNDHDGRTDWRGDGSGDSHCSGLTDNNEFPTPAWGCGLGPELLLLGPFLAVARRRRTPRLRLASRSTRPPD